MRPLVAIVVLFALTPAIGCFLVDDFVPIPAPMDLNPWPEEVCVPNQGGATLLQKELRCFQGQAEHAGNCNQSGANCESGCLFTLITEESAGGDQALVRINRDEFVPEGHSQISEVALTSTPSSTEKEGMNLYRVYRGSSDFYKPQINLANVRVSPNCP
jgi:hypothetical protein